MKLSFFLSLGFYFFCFSCKKDHKDKPADPVCIRFNPEALAFVQFLLNKYYIYKDSASGMLDSVIVTQSEIKKEFQPEFSWQTGFGSAYLPAYFYQSFSLLLTQREWELLKEKSKLPVQAKQKRL